jgi:hypothetical protein
MDPQTQLLVLMLLTVQTEQEAVVVDVEELALEHLEAAMAPKVACLLDIELLKE